MRWSLTAFVCLPNAYVYIHTYMANHISYWALIRTFLTDTGNENCVSWPKRVPTNTMTFDLSQHQWNRKIWSNCKSCGLLCASSHVWNFKNSLPYLGKRQVIAHALPQHKHKVPKVLKLFASTSPHSHAYIKAWANSQWQPEKTTV